MPADCTSLLRGRGTSQPRLFFTLCFIFSVVIVVVIVTFLYYPPDGVSVSNGGHHSFDFEHHARRPGLRSELHGRSPSLHELDGGGDDAVLLSSMVVDGNNQNDLDYAQHKSGAVNFDGTQQEQHSETSPRLRHHHAHHNHGGKPVVMTVEEVEQRPMLSNVIESRLLHFDLKGAPPKISYLKEVLKLAKRAGINGLLLEWEDTFPWSGSLSNLSMIEGGYTRDEVEELIDFAELVLDFEVIPLVQTFGHVEFVLKGAEFRHLREIDQDPQSFCPSKLETMKVVKEMIDQTLELHKRSRFVHIGCDEVYNLRLCPICTAASEYKEDLFLNHVREVAKYVRRNGRIPIVWDDMLRIISIRRLNESGIGNLVEPMVWVYAEDVDRFVGWEAWEKYAEIFPTVWGAGAFKGAFGETLNIPPLSRHADNTDRWISVITRESPKWKLGTAGLVLTGWMRYDHFAVLCELLPAGLPSLIYNSLQISIPASSTARIKNRVFMLPSQETDEFSSSSTTNKPNPSSSSEIPHDYNFVSSSEKPSSSSRHPPSSPPAHTHMSKRSPNYRRQIAHPRILMAKDRLARLSTRSEITTGEIYDKFDHVAREFCQILNCPNYHTRLDHLLKGSDTELNFASRCNFSGVAFFRSLFRLKGLLHESNEFLAKIEKKRGWVTPYNIRHNYSLPLRVDEVLSEVPRLKNQLQLVVKSIETSLKPIFRQEDVLEWIEQNVWDPWKALENLEIAGNTLKTRNVWPRRPIPIQWEMVQDLKLSRVDPDEL